MKALHCPRYGSPDVLKLIDIPTPTPKRDEVRIKVKAGSINAYDAHILRGSPILVRLMGGLFRPRNKTLGADIAGIVDAVGEEVTAFAPGDMVYTCLADLKGDGGFTQYACAKQSAVAHMPACLNFAQAAAVPMAAVTALQALRDAGQVKKGAAVLINGASGGVGSFAIQIAKHLGAVVTAVCAKHAAPMARQLGADHVIDYERQDFTKGSATYDVIIDIAANHSLSACRRVLKPNGICAVVGFSTLWHVFKVMLLGKSSPKKCVMVMANNSLGAELSELNALLESGEIVPVIDRCYPLEKAADAFWHFEKQHVRGKIVLTLC